MTDGVHLVIGGSGGCGAALVAELSRRGRRVRTLTRRAWPAPDGVEASVGDAREVEAVASAATGASVIYQCANPAYERWAADFPPMQQAVLAGAMRSGAKVVMADNLYMYGPADAPLREDTPMGATDTNGRLRAEMARQLLAAHAEGRARVVIGRSSDYFGPGPMNSAVGDLFFGAAAAGRRPRWLVSLDQPHALSYLPDVAAGLATLGETDAGDGRAWHLPVSPALTAREWTAELSRALGRPLEVGRISRPMLTLAGLVSPTVRQLRGTLYQWERPWIVDDSAFRRAFGASAAPVTTAVAATVDGLRRRLERAPLTP